MDKRYDSYCAVDPLFYDSVTNTEAVIAEFAPDRPLPRGWQRDVHDDWTLCGPSGDKLPEQGWKIHVSAGLDNAERVLDLVWDYCVARGIGFKFLRGPKMLLLRNSKYAARGASGKFITVYPHDEAELARACAELAALLAGEHGPYILSDLRYGPGPVHLRYGAFAARYCLSEDGDVVPALADPTGTLVPDRRDPVFHVPEWVQLPEFLAPHLAARNAVSTTEVPYAIEEALHFSNGGGLYRGRDTRTGQAVVLKEARPGAGLDATGTDAITRLRRERDTLRALADVPGVVRVHDDFVLGEHEFLVLDYVDATPLNKALVDRYPLVDADSTGTQRAGFSAWATHVHGQIERIVHDIHGHGIVYGDLHLFNVLVDDQDRVTLLDFEVARPAAERGLPALRNQAFAAPRDRTGFAVDDYALACMRLSLFLPLTSVLRLAPAKVSHLAAIIAEHFPVDPDWLAEAVRVILGDRPAAPWSLPDDLPGRLAAGIAASATPVRKDRLFPGDIMQFHAGGVNLAHGAAGVLWALAECGFDRRPEHEQWLADRVRKPESGSRLGFYDGLHGVAYALHRLGRKEEALDLLELCLAEPRDGLSLDLASGLAGIGLTLGWFADQTGDPRLADEAEHVATLVALRLRAAPPAAAISGGKHPRAGLNHGASGIALLFLRRYERTGDPALLDLAATALRRDLVACVIRDNGAMDVNEGWRTMPYLAEGSTGVGLVLDQYLRHRGDEEFRAASAAIRRSARSPFYAQPGLFAGRAGIVAYLAVRVAHADPGDPARAEDVAELHRQAGLLSWHVLPYGEHFAMPGNQLLRLSMDLATGTAGGLLALTMAANPAVGLPFHHASPAPHDRAPGAAPAPAGSPAPELPARGR
ncbi:class III lanthionine synthetase LanKC [Actinoplanes sp. N902-109]|uniref:class III lanthionine synthetase LanKC n=1 Tax=Actinoplanes sp. (strain N902-109) TaxID=649831 RepID=UPI00032942EF|nr:class III lanthionine synthetase LanKC [Actinoplanes sp. N902-109]AGL17149.1 serine/threonine protein kinase-like protein [Actinoplanes sp. N902-109]